MKLSKELNDKARLRMARQQVDAIVRSLPSRVKAAALTRKSKLPFKALSLRELLIHRIADLSQCAMELYEQNRVVPAFVLTRAVMETIALIYWLHKKLSDFRESKNVKNLDQFLMKAMLGSKDGSTGLSSHNVLTAVDHVNKKFNGFRKRYDVLCEFAHPNWSGVLGPYGKINRQKMWLDLGLNKRVPPLIIGLEPFVEGLKIFIEYYNGLGSLIRGLNDYFEGAECPNPTSKKSLPKL